MTTTNLLEPLRNSAKLINQILSGKIGEINEEIYGTLEYLRTNLDAVSKSILDILDFASIETQGLTLEFTTHDVNTLVSEAMESLGSIIIDKGFVLMKELPDKITAYCDKAQIVRVLKNIIVNAIKFTEKECNITIGAKKTDDNMTKIWIQDNGIGIKKGDLERIFDQYYKVDPKSQGSGLGLSVAKTIVEAHYGIIKAKSEGKNKGSTFTIQLPKDKQKYEQLASQQTAEKIEIDA
jgi:signal transduction histidine kinase